MKRIITLILAVSMTLGIITGCGSKKQAVDTPAPVANTTETPASKEEPVATTPGTELTDFMSKYTDTKTLIWDRMSAKFDEEENLTFAMGTLGFAFADLALIDILLFDALTVKEGDVFKGQLMFSGIDAWKKVKGDIIEFGYDYTYVEEKAQSKSGDRIVTNGKLDKSNNSLVYEFASESSGKVISKHIIEVTRNSDTSYSSQSYFLDLDTNDGMNKNHLTGYLTWFDDKDIISYLVEKDISDTSFTYNSIFSKKNIKPEEMAAGATVTMKTSYVDGKAQFEQLESN